MDVDEDDDELRVILMSRTGTVDTHTDPDVLEPDAQVEEGDHTPIIELEDGAEEVRWQIVELI